MKKRDEVLTPKLLLIRNNACKQTTGRDGSVAHVHVSLNAGELVIVAEPLLLPNDRQIMLGECLQPPRLCNHGRDDVRTSANVNR